MSEQSEAFLPIMKGALGFRHPHRSRRTAAALFHQSMFCRANRRIEAHGAIAQRHHIFPFSERFGIGARSRRSLSPWEARPLERDRRSEGRVCTCGPGRHVGSRVFKNDRQTEDHPVITKLLHAGAILHVQSAAPELYLLGVTWSDLWGVTRNPWNREITPGGSSGGSAALVAARHGDARHRFGHGRLDPDPMRAYRPLRL